MTAPRATSAITAMWACDNSVSPAADDRGRGYAPATPDRLAAFASAGELNAVYVAAPPAAFEGPVGEWFGQTCRALRAADVEVSAAGGDAAWIAEPGRYEWWLNGANEATDVDRVHLDVEPWSEPAWVGDPAAAMRDYLRFLDAARALSGALPIDVAVPWWLAHEPYLDLDAPGAIAPVGAIAAIAADDVLDVARASETGPTMLDAVLARADRVSVLAHADPARGPGGILACAARAVAACARAGHEFVIGVATETPDAAGGASRTFFDEGPVALMRESFYVREALTAEPGYRGVAVAHHRSWRRLLGV